MMNIGYTRRVTYHEHEYEYTQGCSDRQARCENADPTFWYVVSQSQSQSIKLASCAPQRTNAKVGRENHVGLERRQSLCLEGYSSCRGGRGGL